MDTELPVALRHLREGDIVRLCGLALAARGQEHLRTGKVQQMERVGGTLRAMILSDQVVLHVLARFSDAGLEEWECSCVPDPPEADPAGQPPAGRAPCDHLAALLTAWVRVPGQFRSPPVASSPASNTIVSQAHVSVAPASPPAGVGSSASVSAGRGGAAPVAPATMPASGAPASDGALGAELAQLAPPFREAAVESLDESGRRFLEVLTLAGGSVSEHEVQRIFARLGLGAPEELPVMLGQLRQRGWLQPVFTGRRPAASKAPIEPAGWRMPDEALAALPRSVPLRPLFTQSPSAAAQPLPPELALHEQRAAAHLLDLLMLVAAQAADCQADHALADLSPEQASRRAEPLGTTADEVRFGFFLLRLLGLVPLARSGSSGAGSRPNNAAAFSDKLPTPVDAGNTRATHAQAGEMLLRAFRLFAGQPSADALQEVFTCWLHAHSARELAELRDAGVRTAWQSQHQAKQAPDIAGENQAAREQLVDLLRAIPAGRWWSFNSLVDFLWAFRPDFLRGRQQTFLRPQWWLERLEDGKVLSLDLRIDWRHAEGRYIALCFRRALHWLGLVDLALDERGRLKGFRITPLGAFLLGSMPGSRLDQEALQSLRSLRSVSDSAHASPAVAAPARLRALDDGRLLAPLAVLSEPLLEMLLCWCEPAGAGAGGLLFLPTAARLAAALDAGQSADAWLALLEQGESGAALSTILEQVRRWLGMYGKVRLYASAALLEVSDPALMRELEVAVDLSAQFVDHLLSPALAVVRAETIEALLEALRRRGYVPWMAKDTPLERP